MNPIKILAVGSDPEVFFVDQGGMPHSVEGLLGGTKRRPKPMGGLPPGFFVQEDNVAAEFNIPPARSAEEFANSILLGLKFIEGEARKKGMAVICAPSLDFPEEQLKTKHARTLGCDPDLNVWKLSFNESPTPPEKMRTAAGHVHVSWKEPQEDQRVVMGKMCDLFLGVPSILVTEYSKRRQLYGRAGAVRMKPYGLEYRTLDNFWVNKPAYCQQVYRNVLDISSRLLAEGPTLVDALEDFQEEIQLCINEHNKGLARVLVNRFNVPEFQ
jgi:hypothetical protein